MSNIIHFLAPKIRTARGHIRSLYLPKKYKIKAGYFHRKKVLPFDATTSDEEYQWEVYQIASQIVADEKLSKVLDIGTGSGYKLNHFFKDYDTIGIETPAALSLLKHTYPDRKWLDIHAVNFDSLVADIIICADVIEHVTNPDALMQNILAVQGWEKVIISTPDRDTKRGASDYGPSPNPYHFREWNKSEFHSYISQYISIQQHYISSKKNATQLIIGIRQPQ